MTLNITTILPRSLRVLAFLILVIGNLAQTLSLQTAKQWKLFSYNFQPQAPVNDQNFFNPTNVLATGVAVSHDRIFVATPKLFSGVSSTVSFISKAQFGDSPVLQAYPDWSFSITGRTNFNCSDLILVSAYRMRIDSCNRLWVLDAGVSRSLEDYQITCPPKILIFDLATDQVVRRIEFPKGVLRGESLFTNLVIDETTSKSGTCDDVWAYITDTVEPAIVVYDSQRDVTWRVSHPAMYPDPDFAQSEIHNDRFILMDGIVGFTFSPTSGLVYFQPLATDRIFSVHKDVLRAGPIQITQVLQVKLVGKKSSQGIGMTVSPVDGSLIFSPLTETAIASWNPNTNQQAVLAYDPDRLQFVADITTSASEPGVIYIVSSKFHRFFLKNLNTGEVNNRILRLELPHLTGPHLKPSGIVTPGLENYPGINLPSYVPGLPNLGSALNQHLTTAAVNSFIGSQHPYNYRLTNVLNYTEPNPFLFLNQRGAFPPTKAQRAPPQRSFLDSLTNLAIDTKTHPQQHILSSSRSYFYGKGINVSKREIKNN